MKTEAILIYIGLSLSKEGFKWKRHEIQAKKTASGFITTRTEERTKRISKDKLLVPDTILYDTHKYLGYWIWCLPEDEEKAKSILEAKVVSVATEIRDEAMKMFVHLENYEKLINQ